MSALLRRFLTPGTRLRTFIHGAISDRPTPAPRSVAALRSSSVASAARARSLASPAPPAIPSAAVAPTAPAPATALAIPPAGTKAGSARGEKNAAREPIPVPAVYAKLSGSPNSGVNCEAIPLIFSLAASSSSSSSSAAVPSAADSNVPTAPAPIPAARFSYQVESSTGARRAGRSASTGARCLSSSCSARLARIAATTCSLVAPRGPSML